MLLSKYSPSRQFYSKLIERVILTRSASSTTTTNVSHTSSDNQKQYRTPLSTDPEFRAPSDNELPRAKTSEMKGITFNARDFYQNYFPNDPVEARLPTPWHMDIYYRKQYYIIGALIGVLFGIYVSYRRILVDRARRRDWEKHHGDPLSYYDIVGPIDPNVTRKVWDDHPNMPRPQDFYDKDGKSNNNSNNYGLLKNSYKNNNRTSNGNKLLDDFYSFVVDL
ncbi:unnamed protein product [Rotaria sordida]|uniref:Uncharacterized protein n=1 Tax=Rotaria sordida TaxID=392033 RepID=A0A815WA17_9BILA|nr:unnamed protein product [Rotaria sordida]CAF1261106.1 unnamed protein product [Rotaria sordida]CAF1541172.1 unnamed protein product [Rotaria sordida]CAF1541276.1 unnamed protein product [Rotaria sordida]